MSIHIRDDLGVGHYFDIGDKLSRLASEDLPVFVKAAPDIKAIQEAAKPYRDYRDIILVGYGGSNTSFLAYCKALYKGDKRVEIINTVDPDYLAEVRDRCPKDESLVILVSKSGTTPGVLQAYLFFKGYKIVVVTEDNGKALSEIAREEKLDMVVHPPVGGRFSGRTACALFPAAVLGLPIEEIERGFVSIYDKCRPDIKIDYNPALKLAADCLILEEKGFNEIFMPLYSPYLEGFTELIVQLVHESVCKHGKGQTIYTAMGPEAQHHTNQRYFGGKRNVIGLFVSVKGYAQDHALNVDIELEDIGYKDSTFAVFQGLTLSKAMEYEFAGTYMNSIEKKIPCANIELKDISAQSIGQFMAFMQYFAVYSAVLRDVNPFDQPAVEDSKRISYRLIKDRAS